MAIEDTVAISLRTIDHINWRQALQVLVEPEQLRFVADHQPVALVILAKCYVQPSGVEWTPCLILQDGEPVGVFALAFTDATTVLINFAIDRNHQRKGIARAAVEDVVTLLEEKRPGCDRLILTVHPDNVAAQALYRSTGFVPTGDWSDGEPVWSRAIVHDRPTRS